MNEIQLANKNDANATDINGKQVKGNAKNHSDCGSFDCNASVFVSDCARDCVCARIQRVKIYARLVQQI